MIAYVQVGKDQWSIAEVDDELQIVWWCGERHKWVSPASSHWVYFRDCANVVFESVAAARRFARSRGWEDR